VSKVVLLPPSTWAASTSRPMNLTWHSDHFEVQGAAKARALTASPADGIRIERHIHRYQARKRMIVGFERTVRQNLKTVQGISNSGGSSCDGTVIVSRCSSLPSEVGSAESVTVPIAASSPRCLSPCCLSAVRVAKHDAPAAESQPAAARQDPLRPIEPSRPARLRLRCLHADRRSVLPGPAPPRP
jgi:hypothetical protein